MKIIKPFHLGLLPRPYRFAGKNLLCATSLVFFRLGVSGKRPEIVRDHLAWRDILQLLPRGTPLDFGLHKLRGEVSLSGSAFSPGGQLCTQLQVRIQVGNIDKRLQVIGDRQWQYGVVPSYQHTPPQPFAQMPLTRDRAFGGKGYVPNPTGRGYHNKHAPAFVGNNHGPLPNIEYPNEPTKAGPHKFRTATFLPDAVGTAERMKRAGTYNKQWLKQDFPGFARDVDWSIFNTSPSDQKLQDSKAPPFFTGGEPYRLENLHPNQPVLEGELPEVRVRNFLRSTSKEFEELSPVADTLWFFPEHSLGALLYHATTEIADNQALDVQALMAAYELTDSQPRPHSHYQHVMALRSDKKTCGQNSFNESQLCPPSKDEPASSSASGLPVPSKSQIARCDFDLTPLMDAVAQQADEAQKQANRNQAIVEKKLDSQASVPVSDPQKEAELALKRAQEPLQPAIPAAPPTHAAEAVGKALGRFVHDAVEKQQSLAGLDLTGVHLDGLDLSGQNLRGTRLAHAELSQLKLRGAQLQGACFLGSKLQKLECNRADASRADFSEAKLQEVNFYEATLTESLWRKAELKHCEFGKTVLNAINWLQCTLSKTSFVHAHFQGGSWVKVEASDCDFSHCQLNQVSLLECQLAQVNFSEAQLFRTSFLNVTAPQANFNGAHLDRVLVGGTSALPKSTFRKIVAKNCGFRGAQLHECDFTEASFSRCDLAKANLTKACLKGALLSRCLMREILAPQSDFQQADLFQSVLTKSDFEGAQFQDASLLDAETRGAIWKNTDLRGAAPQPRVRT